MQSNYSKLFKSLDGVYVPSGLSNVTIKRIRREQRRAAFLRLTFVVPMAFLSSAAVVFSFKYLADEIAQSGLPQYLSVIFSDGGTALTYWKEFSISIADQLPVLSATLFLGAAFALLGTISSIVKNAQTTLLYA